MYFVFVQGRFLVQNVALILSTLTEVFMIILGPSMYILG
jgi:hypothetical protein